VLEYVFDGGGADSYRYDYGFEDVPPVVAGEIGALRSSRSLMAQ
jgi:hypothetical protein